MQHPKISIIIPVLNQKEVLEKALKSVLNQDFTNYELLVIDGESKDGSLSIIEKYKAHINYYESTT